MDDSAISVNPAGVLPVDVTGRHLGTRELRIWFVAYLLWLSGLFVAALLTFSRYNAGDQGALAPWLLALGAFYISLCNTLIPLPTAWIVMLLASDSVGLFESAWLRVAVVAVLGSTATMMANLNEYHVLGYFARARLGERLRRSRVYQWAIGWFDVSPFQTLMLVAFVPIPVDFVRWLAILRRYSRARFALANGLGRLPRYALLAGVSVVLRLDTWEIVLIQVAIVALLGGRLIWAMARGPRKTATA